MRERAALPLLPLRRRRRRARSCWWCASVVVVLVVVVVVVVAPLLHLLRLPLLRLPLASRHSRQHTMPLPCGARGRRP
jgi:hypothetical protein